MRKTLYLGSEAYSRESLLVDLDVLDFLQREALKTNSSPSQVMNTYLKEILKEVESV
jgi:hypothetical protein